jgi:hypothetical protein
MRFSARFSAARLEDCQVKSHTDINVDATLFRPLAVLVRPIEYMITRRDNPVCHNALAISLLQPRLPRRFPRDWVIARTLVIRFPKNLNIGATRDEKYLAELQMHAGVG